LEFFSVAGIDEDIFYWIEIYKKINKEKTIENKYLLMRKII
jgi:hypothetical protein